MKISEKIIKMSKLTQVCKEPLGLGTQSCIRQGVPPDIPSFDSKSQLTILVAKAGQVEMHFADIQTLVSMLLWHRNTAPSMTTFATTLSSKSERLNPKIMPLRVVDLRNMDDYGITRYVLLLQECNSWATVAAQNWMYI